MNKYFLLLIASFASLSLNAAEGQSGKKDEWTFIERGETAAGKHYILEDRTDHFLIQVRQNGTETGRKTNLANGVTVTMSGPETRSIIKTCQNNTLKFQKVIVKEN